MSRKQRAKPDRSYYVTRSLVGRAMRANKPAPAPSPTVRQLASDRWAILAPDGLELAVVGSNAAAWAWLDRHSAEVARDIDRVRRIKTSPTFP